MVENIKATLVFRKLFYKSILDIFHRSVDVHHHEFEKKRENELGLLPVL